MGPTRLVFCALAIVSGASALGQAKWKSLGLGDGQIEYPSTFAVRRGASDDATFVAPGGRVEFYAVSYLDKKSPPVLAAGVGERRVSEKVAKKNGVTTIWRTFQSKDGSARSVEAKSWDGGKGWQVFGIKYRTTDDLRRRRADYGRFKGSLVVPGC